MSERVAVWVRREIAVQPMAIEQTAGLANPTQPYELGVKS
jgi:hypothetical protein